MLTASSPRQEKSPQATAHRPIGQFMRRLPDGLCRFTVFDNELGQAIEDKIARCDEIRTPPPTRERSKKFTWGG